MEFWLFQNNDKLQLPVPPSEFEVTGGNLNNTIVVQSIGEVNILGKSRLNTITISSFFPSHEYSFCQYTGFPRPYECVQLIEKFRELGQVRLLITGTNVNKIFYIEEFTYGEKDGTGDIYFTIQFKEFKKLVNTSKSINTNVKRPINSKYEKTQPAKKTPIYATVNISNESKKVRNYSQDKEKILQDKIRGVKA